MAVVAEPESFVVLDHLGYFVESSQRMDSLLDLVPTLAPTLAPVLTSKWLLVEQKMFRSNPKKMCLSREIAARRYIGTEGQLEAEAQRIIELG